MHLEWENNNYSTIRDIIFYFFDEQVVAFSDMNLCSRWSLDNPGDPIIGLLGWWHWKSCSPPPPFSLIWSGWGQGKRAQLNLLNHLLQLRYADYYLPINFFLHLVISPVSYDFCLYLQELPVATLYPDWSSSVQVDETYDRFVLPGFLICEGSSADK